MLPIIAVNISFCSHIFLQGFVHVSISGQCGKDACGLKVDFLSIPSFSALKCSVTLMMLQSESRSLYHIFNQ